MVDSAERSIVRQQQQQGASGASGSGGVPQGIQKATEDWRRWGTCGISR